MKKANASKSSRNGIDIPEEVSFRGGVRGKYYKAYRKGHTVTIHEPDGGTTVQYFGPEEGSIMLDPDVRKHFRSSKSVNQALRIVIAAGTKRNIKPKSRQS